jgi:hypothetical protein
MVRTASTESKELWKYCSQTLAPPDHQYGDNENARLGPSLRGYKWSEEEFFAQKNLLLSKYES